METYCDLSCFDNYLTKLKKLFWKLTWFDVVVGSEAGKAVVLLQRLRFSNNFRGFLWSGHWLFLDYLLYSNGVLVEIFKWHLLPAWEVASTEESPSCFLAL